eukprot:5418193-Lingulodinium_polyedra.AAC.1
MFLRVTGLPPSSSFSVRPLRKLMSASTALSRASMPDMPMKAWNHSPLESSMEKVRTWWPVAQRHCTPQHGAAQQP